MRVYELMRTEYLSVRSDLALEELRDRLANGFVCHAAVVTPDDPVLGIVSHEDVYWGLLMGPRPEERGAARTMRVGDVMTAPAPIVDEDLDVADACAFLCGMRIDAALVTRDGRPVGMMTARDVLRTVADGQLRDPLSDWLEPAAPRAPAPRPPLEPSRPDRYPG